MAHKTLRLSVGSIFTKGPGKIYFYRYQLDGHRKTVSLQTTNRTEAVKKAEALLPIIKATSTEVVAAHVQQAKGLSIPVRELPLNGVWGYYSTHPERATPATVNEQIQYRTTLEEFIRFIDKLTSDTIYQMRLGCGLSRTCRGARELGAATQETIGNLLMPSSGSCELALRGVTFRLPMATGKTHTGAFAVGATKEPGSACWRP